MNGTVSTRLPNVGRRSINSILVLSLCALLSLQSFAVPQPYTIPQPTNDGWRCDSLGNVGLDTNLIEQLSLHIRDNSYKNIHSVIVAKNGKLVLEEYFAGQNSAGQLQGFNQDTLNEMKSATKSVNALLIGIAIDRHLIAGVDEKVSTFFPEYAEIFTNKQKASIRLKDLLSMTAGLRWDEWSYPYTDARNDAAMMASKADFFRYVLERPVATAPGKKFLYNSGISLMLGEIVHKASEQQADQFAKRFLFSPLGITNYFWQTTPSGVVNTLGGLWLRPRDMAKIGQLLLDGGRWNNQRIVSEEWIKQSTKQQVNPSDLPAGFYADGYGYQWWLGTFHLNSKAIQSYSARGQGGQFIIVFPAERMVAVITGWNDNSLIVQPLEMLQKFILPSAAKK